MSSDAISYLASIGTFVSGIATLATLIFLYRQTKSAGESAKSAGASAVAANTAIQESVKARHAALMVHIFHEMDEIKFGYWEMLRFPAEWYLPSEDNAEYLFKANVLRNRLERISSLAMKGYIDKELLIELWGPLFFEIGWDMREFLFAVEDETRSKFDTRFYRDFRKICQAHLAENGFDTESIRNKPRNMSWYDDAIRESRRTRQNRRSDADPGKSDV